MRLGFRCINDYFNTGQLLLILTMSQDRVAVVVGAGPVGCIEACFLAERGYQVHVYELRNDIREEKLIPGKSINLTLSVRGLEALRRFDLDKDVILKHSVPLYARLIHDKKGSTSSIPYSDENKERNY